MPMSILAHNLADLLADIDAAQEFKASLTILGHLTSPRRDIPRDQVVLRLDRHDLTGLLPQVGRLARVDSRAVYDLLEAQLTQAEEQALPQDLTLSDWWRRAVENDPDYAWEQPGLNFLISALRDSLQELIARQPAVAQRNISALLGAGDAIRERLGLWGLTVHPTLIGDEQVSSIVVEHLFDSGTYHERAVLLHRRFTDLPSTVRDDIHRAIGTGPPRRLDVTDDDHQQIVDWWRWRMLSVLPQEAVTEQEQEWLAQLVSERGHPPDSLFLRSLPTVWFGSPPQSIDLQSSLQRGPEEAVQELRRAGNAWDSLRAAVVRAPDELTELALHFSDEDYPQLWPYFSGYAEALRQSETPFSWTPLIELAARIARARLGQQEHVLNTMLWLLRDGLRQAKNPIPQDLMDQVLEIASTLLAEHATPLETGDRLEDLDRNQLSSVAGAAASLFMVSLWHALETDEGRLSRGWPLGTAVRINAALEDEWGGIEVRYALGEFAWLLEWCEPGWNARHVNVVALPPANPQSARAFVRGYLASEHLNRPVMRELTQVYRSLITALAGTAANHQDDDLTRRLIGHIVAGWSADLPGFGIDGLLGQLNDALNDELRGEIVRLMMLNLEAVEGQQRADLWERMDQYWTFVVDQYRGSESVERSDELTWLFSWVRYAPVELTEIETRLYVSIDHAAHGFGLERLIDALAARAEVEPLPVARLTSRLVQRWSSNQEMHWYGRELEQVFAGIRRSGNDAARQIALQAVAELLKTGRGDFSKSIGA